MIVKTHPEEIRSLLADTSFLRGGHAERAVFPETAEEVAEVLKEASASGIPVTVSGAGTGTTGGRVPFGGTVLATERLGGLRRLERTEGGGGLAVCGPALPLRDLQEAAAAAGLRYPPDPTEATSWLGGNVATNASGSRSFRFGPTRRWIRRLRVVLADGTVVDARRGRVVADRRGHLLVPRGRGAEEVDVGRRPPPAVKSATGYASGAGTDLVDLFVGSEGTLGVVTEIEVELVDAPDGVLGGVAFFPAEEAAWAFIRDARERSYRARGWRGPSSATPRRTRQGGRARPGRRLEATALEYYGRDALDFLREEGQRLPDRARAGVPFEQETSEESEAELAAGWLELVERAGGLADDTWVATDAAGRERLRALRHSLPEGMNRFLERHGQQKFSTDMAVPDAAMESLFAEYRDIVAASGLRSATFGHAGQNHLHLNLLPANADEARRAEETYGRLVAAALGRGGVLSAEHGIGKLKAARFAATAPRAELARIARVKARLDPSLILGRGTLLPEELLAELVPPPG